jgi:hypothetical protein
MVIPGKTDWNRLWLEIEEWTNLLRTLELSV